jgi:hydroxymethylbilane synthase
MPDAQPVSSLLLPLPPRVRPHGHALPLRVGTRGSPLALAQTTLFLDRLAQFCPALRLHDVFREEVIRTTGDRVQDRSLAEIGGKGLFAKEIHEALADGRVDFAIHSLKDLETVLPLGIVLACTLTREDARDALILGPGCLLPDPADPLEALPPGALIGTNSVRRQAQLLHARPDLRMALLRGNVGSRIEKVRRGDCTASLLALAGLRRLGIEGEAAVVLDPDSMVPAACQGIVGITVREDDTNLRELLAAIEDPAARAVSTAERAMLAVLDGSCRTPIGGYARFLPPKAGDDSKLHLTGLVARADGSFLLKRSVHGEASDAARLGTELGASLRADSPHDIFG